MERANFKLDNGFDTNKFMTLVEMYGNCLIDLSEAKLLKQNASTQAQIEEAETKIDCAFRLILSAERKIKKIANTIGGDALIRFLQDKLDNLNKLKARPTIEHAKSCGLIKNYVEAVVFSDDKMLEDLIKQNIFSLEKTLDYVNNNCISKGL